MSTQNFCHQILNMSQSKHLRNDHVLHAFDATVFLSILGQNCHINCHNLQMTGPKCLKLDILAFEYINRKPVKNQECLLIGYDFASI